MKKFFGLRPPNVRSRWVFRKRPQSDDVGRQPETGGGVTTESRYRIRDKDLQEIHKAAYRGDVSEVQRLLSLHPERLNDRDRKKRTALHLACAFGHPEVVTLLAEKKCQMNFGDNKNRTALMKAVECQEEECATILLKHGADPHMKDFRSNTALHYAAMGDNTAIAEQLLRHQADMEATNEFDLTPLLVAVRKNRQKMVEFLLKRHANIDAVDKWKSNAILISEFRRERCKKSSDNNSRALQESAKEESRKTNLSTVDECSERDPSSSLTCKPGTNDSRSVSTDGLFDVDTKTSIDVKDPGPHEAVGMDDVQPFRPGQHLGMTSEEGQARLDGNEKTYTHVVQEENDTQRPLSREQDNRILHDAILTNCLQQQKETEINLKKMNSEVSESYEKEKDLLPKKQILWDEIAILRLQRDTLKTQNQEMEKQYLEDTANVKEKNDCLQKTVKLNEETLTKTVFEYNRQLNVPTAENTMLNSQLENERQSKERLKTEAESDHHYKLSEQLIRHLQNAFQGLRDECLHLMDKSGFAMCNRKEKKEILSQQLSKAGSKFSSLDTELPHTSYAVRERTLISEPVLKDLNQTQCQEEEIEHMYQREQGKVNTYIGKPESLKEKGSDLQSGNMLLRLQLDDAFNTSDNNENSGMNIEVQLQELRKVLQAECEKQDRIVKERHKEAVNKLIHLEGRICQYENDKSEREVAGRQLQQELPDTTRKLPMSEASLEVRSHYRMNSQAETQDFKELEQLRCQQQEAKARHTEDARCTEKMQDHVQKLETENTDLTMTTIKLVGLIEQLHRNLSGTSLEEAASQENVDPLNDYDGASISDVELRVKRLESELCKVKTSFKIELEDCKRLYLEELKLMSSFKNKLNKTNDRLAEMRTQLLTKAPQNPSLSTAPRKPVLLPPCIGRLKDRFLPRGNLAPREQLVIPTSTPQTSTTGTLSNLMKAQAAAQENLDPLNEYNNISIRCQMGLGSKGLESELFKVKTSQDSCEVELKIYKQTYLEEQKVRISLENKLNTANERLAEARTDLLAKERQNQFLSTALRRPVLEPPRVGSLNTKLLLSGNPAPREDVVIPKSTAQASNESLEAYCTKLWQKFEKELARGRQKDAAEFESKYNRTFPPLSIDDQLKNAKQEYVQILNKKYMI